MSRVFIAGLGAVSPAGWGVTALRDALCRNDPVPVQVLERPGWDKPLKSRPVPAPVPRPSFLAHPRLRRAGPLTHYLAGAALEATVRLPERPASGKRLGLVVCLLSGPLQYASRFFEETVKDPATASPLLFPETVFAAPASHVATLLGGTLHACTVLGDPAVFLQGLALAVDWLEAGCVDACLVLGGEEFNWLHAEAAWHFDRRTIISAGAGVVCLSLNPADSIGVELETITDVHTYTASCSQRQAARNLRRQLPEGAADELLCDGGGGAWRPCAAECAAWQGWPGQRLSPKAILGEGLMAAAGWQVVAAADAVAARGFPAANVSLVGGNQQAIGARFVRVG